MAQAYGARRSWSCGWGAFGRWGWGRLAAGHGSPLFSVTNQEDLASCRGECHRLCADSHIMLEPTLALLSMVSLAQRVEGRKSQVWRALTYSRLSGCLEKPSFGRYDIKTRIKIQILMSNRQKLGFSTPWLLPLYVKARQTWLFPIVGRLMRRWTSGRPRRPGLGRCAGWRTSPRSRRWGGHRGW